MTPPDPRRRRAGLLAAATVSILVAATIAPAGARAHGEATCAGAPEAGAASDGSGRLLHDRPQGPAPAHFPESFPEICDHEWEFRIGGFGGLTAGGSEATPTGRPLVIFVHGNVVDHADWYPVQDAFRAAGWSDGDLWALSYNGLGNNSGSAGGTPNPRRDAEHAEAGSDGLPRNTDNRVNVADLAEFIDAVRQWTGTSRFTLVTHSLGVTLARETLRVRSDLAADLVALVGIAGANHGTSLCPPGSESTVHGCDELAAGSPFLATLNQTEGTPRPTWLMVYDGSGASDIAYLGTYSASPRLEGAWNCTFPFIGHNDLRLAERIVGFYRSFVEDAEDGAIDMAMVPPNPVPGTCDGDVRTSAP